VQEGVVFSKLQPGLATVLVAADGGVQVKTWQPSDDSLLEHMRYARQNGVPLIEYDPHTASGIPGDLVNLWGPGNWSGSAAEDLRTLRAGLCLQNAYGHRYLIYGYFSAATPSAMARVFQAYQCTYAMHLDMNALEHTYLALYVRSGPQIVVEHLRWTAVGIAVLGSYLTDAGAQATLARNNTELLQQLQSVHGLTA